MHIETLEFNPLAVNTYVLYDETGECAIIDAACFNPNEQEQLFDFISDHNLTVTHLLNTHLHFDHVFGVNAASSRYGVAMEANSDDEFLLDNMSNYMQMFGFKATGEPSPIIGNKLDEGDIVKFGSQQLRVWRVPGHSPGSIVFHNEAADCVFVGDVLFNSSIGRTDLPYGNTELLLEGIRTKLFTMPDHTVVYPGHGPSTTIGHEKKFNPFFT